MAEKRRLLATVPAEVFAATPPSDDAREEALALILAALTTHHPDWFGRDGTTALRNHLTGEIWKFGPPIRCNWRDGWCRKICA